MPIKLFDQRPTCRPQCRVQPAAPATDGRQPETRPAADGPKPETRQIVVGRDTLALGGGPRAGAALPAAPAVRDAANRLLAEAKPAQPFGPSAIARDIQDANAPAPAKAADLVAANAAAEAQARAALAPDQQAAYDRVAAAVAHDPAARLDLQVLAAEGRLAGGRNAADGKGLLAHLDGLATQPLAEGIDRGALLAGTVREIAHPSSINQRKSYDCAAATMGVKLAMEQPAEYARLVGGLASPAGEVALAGGQTLRRARGSDADDGRGRTASSRLLQTAFMNFARPGRGYDARSDRFADGLRGLGVADVNRLASAAFGKPVSPVGGGPAGMARVAEAANAGNAVPVGVKVGSALHEMLVMRADATTVDAINTQRGTIERYPRARFAGLLQGASLVGQ